MSKWDCQQNQDQLHGSHLDRYFIFVKVVINMLQCVPFAESKSDAIHDVCEFHVSGG